MKFQPLHDRLLLKPMRKLQHLGGLADALRDLRARKTVFHQRIGQILEDVQVGIEGERLKHHRYPAAPNGRVRHIPAANMDSPAVERREA